MGLKVNEVQVLIGELSGCGAGAAGQAAPAADNNGNPLMM